MSSDVIRISELPVGAKVKFGRYLAQDIIWNIAAKNHEGYPKNSVTLFASDVLCEKEFDAKEGSYGNSDYKLSNISSWLNSNAIEWYKQTHEKDISPTYSNESGFLYDFSEDEINSIRLTNLAVYADGYKNVPQRVFFPSATELGVNSLYAEGGRWEYIYQPEKTYWTRTEYDFEEVYFYNPAGSGYYTRRYSYEQDGVRPALNISGYSYVSKDADSDGCYVYRSVPKTSILHSIAPTFEDYKSKISTGNFKTAVKVEWLNPDESVNYEFTNALYGIDVNLNVNYQNGSRRSCTLKINNDKNRFPINYNNIWFGQKFKLWMGIYLDDNTPYYFPQGVFYVSNPTEVYSPSERIITINGVDKWAYLDGSLFGKLSGTYQTSIGVNLYDALRELLRTPISTVATNTVKETNIEDYFLVNLMEWSWDGDILKAPSSYDTYELTLTAKHDMSISFDCEFKLRSGYDTSWFKTTNGNQTVYVITGEETGGKVYHENISTQVKKGNVLHMGFKSNYQSSGNFYCNISNFMATFEQPIDPISPMLATSYINKLTKVKQSDGTEIEQSVLLCPYTATVERGGTMADVILEYATILCANVYYDVHGRLILEPMIDTADDITDTNKEILWNYSVDEKTFLGLTQTFNFDRVYNDIIVLGNIVNGYQFKGRVQNRNPLSNTSIQKIGMKTKEPFEDNQYVSDEQCIELAKYYAKTDTILQKSGSIPSVVLYHIDVNKLVSVSTPNNNMSKELFLITGFSLSASGTMTLSVTSVNILKDFSVVEV